MITFLDLLEYGMNAVWDDGMQRAERRRRAERLVFPPLAFGAGISMRKGGLCLCADDLRLRVTTRDLPLVQEAIARRQVRLAECLQSFGDDYDDDYVSS